MADRSVMSDPSIAEEEVTAVSFLDPRTIAWLNKRRPKASHSTPLVTPTRARQLKTIFDGLDFDRSGGVSLEEMTEAIDYVAAADPTFQNAEGIKAYFKSMDVDGNGIID